MHESMFETWLKTAHQNDKKAADERTLVEAMKKLPPEVLFKLANGEAKLGSLKACSPGGGCEGMEWVEQFKETPLFETALQLEQQAIQLEQMEQQHRAQRDAQRDAEREQEPKFWEMQDRIRLQKRLLGLQLAAGQLQQAGAALPSAPAAPPPPEALPPEAAGGAPPPPAEGKVAFALTPKGHRFDAERASLKKEHLLDEARLHQNYNALGHNDPETNQNPATLLNVLRFGPDMYHPTAEARHQAYVAGEHGKGNNAWNPFGGMFTPTSEEQGATTGLLGQVGKVGPKGGEGGKKKEAFDRAAALGRQMAAGDYDRAVTTNAATEIGRDLAKTALDVGALTGLGQKAVGFLGKNPGAALGAAAGAAGGLAHGLQKDPQGQRHILSGLAQGAVGAAGGAAAGHAAQSLHGAMRGGASLGQAAKGAGQQVQQAAGQAITHVQGALKPAAAAAGAAPATSAAAAPATRALAPTLSMGQGRVAPTQPAASKNPSLMAATNQALSFQRAPAGVQAAVKSNPLVASGEIPPEAAHQLMSWSAKGNMTPQAVAQMNSKTPRPAGFVDPREAATRVGG